jgi:hypothetical protein
MKNLLKAFAVIGSFMIGVPTLAEETSRMPAIQCQASSQAVVSTISKFLNEADRRGLRAIYILPLATLGLEGSPTKEELTLSDELAIALLSEGVAFVRQVSGHMGFPQSGNGNRNPDAVAVTEIHALDGSSSSLVFQKQPYIGWQVGAGGCSGVIQSCIDTVSVSDRGEPGRRAPEIRCTLDMKADRHRAFGAWGAQ